MTDESNPNNILIEKSIIPHYFKDPLETPHYKRMYGFGKKESNIIVLPGFENIPLTLNPDCSYLHDYRKLYQKVTDQKADPMQWYRKVLENDLWFVAYFILRIKKANHPFVVARANEIQRGDEIDVVDLYARDHFKTTLLSTCKPIQKILKNPEERICIFSFKRDAALKIYLPIKEEFEKNSMLHAMYPEILFKNPNDYDLWTRDQGFKVIRKGSFREPTLMWSALQEGMPTGMHFTGKIYDDIMTADMATSFSEMEDVKHKFDMSQNLTDNDTGMDSVNWQVIAGTPYHYLDIFEHLKGIKNHDGSLAYKFRKYPATHNGKEDGIPVLLTQTALDKLKRNKATFRTQQLLDPMPDEQRKLNGEWLIEIPKDKLPNQLYKFLLVDPAGDEQNMKTRGKGDRWAIALLGVEPVIDDIGQSNIYILDLFLRRATLAEAIQAICRMYLLAGRVVKLGVEKVGTSTYEIHIANALKKFNVFMTLENERLALLRPGMRNKVERIQSALEWPLQNGKWHYVDSCPEQDIKDLKAEMNTFPLGMDDGLDICSYLNDLTKEYKFPKNEATQSSGFTKPNDMWLDDDEVGRIDSRTMRAWLVG